MSGEYMLRVENRIRVDSRYYRLPGGCVRGDKCFYAHGEKELQKRKIEGLPGLIHSTTSSSRRHVCKINKSQEDLAKKVFVGGLSPSVESDDLRDFFEEKFGPVTEAVVIDSHLGDQVHSRGFGFVTFENEKSVVSAVQAHFVSIYGKKVEIKGAVPRFGSSHIVIAKGISRVQTPFHGMSRDASKFDISGQRLLDNKFSPVITNVQEQNNTRGQYWIKGGREGHTGLYVNTEAACANTTPPPCCSPPGVEESDSWVPTFEEWLPKFLSEVCNRLKEGEWYPLSSLKGDFRATCGLELEHEAIGFHKLNDYIRSIPHLCRIKIVPVGLGPATHMVLLPAGSRITTTTSHQIQDLYQSGPRVGTSLVEMDSNYGAAMSQGTTISGNGSVTSGSIESQLETLAERNVNNLSRQHAVRASVATDQNGAACKALDTVHWNSLRQPSTLVEKSAGEENLDPGRSFVINGQTANFMHQNCLQCMNCYVSCSHLCNSPSGIHDPSDAFIHQVPDCKSTTKTLKTGALEEEGPKIPLQQLTLTPFSYFKHEHISPPYGTTWEKNVPSNPETGVQQSSSGSNLREESPHGNVLPHLVGKSRGPLQQHFFLHPNDEDQETLDAAQTFESKRYGLKLQEHGAEFLSRSYTCHRAHE